MSIPHHNVISREKIIIHQNANNETECVWCVMILPHLEETVVLTDHLFIAKTCVFIISTIKFEELCTELKLCKQIFPVY